MIEPDALKCLLISRFWPKKNIGYANSCINESLDDRVKSYQYK